MKERKIARAMHHRSTDYQSWLNDDETLEIEARLIDTKAYDTTVGFDRELPAGEPVHDMTIRIRLGLSGRIEDISLRMDHSPFDMCSGVLHRFENLRGAYMGKGWNALLKERFAGTHGCRHLIDLLRGIATVAFQSMSHKDKSQEMVDLLTDSCHAFQQQGEVMVRLAEEQARRSNTVND
jgi:hypothetical protein